MTIREEMVEAIKTYIKANENKSPTSMSLNIEAVQELVLMDDRERQALFGDGLKSLFKDLFSDGPTSIDNHKAFGLKLEYKPTQPERYLCS